MRLQILSQRASQAQGVDGFNFKTYRVFLGALFKSLSLILLQLAQLQRMVQWLAARPGMESGHAKRHRKQANAFPVRQRWIWSIWPNGRSSRRQSCHSDVVETGSLEESSGSIGNVVVNVDASGSSAQRLTQCQGTWSGYWVAVQAELIKQNALRTSELMATETFPVLTLTTAQARKRSLMCVLSVWIRLFAVFNVRYQSRPQGLGLVFGEQDRYDANSIEDFRS